MMDERYHQAADLAADYNWPDEARMLRRGQLPPLEFGREVGRNVALFMERPIIGWSRERQEQNRCHGKRLARLRTLLALLWLEERKG